MKNTYEQTDQLLLLISTKLSSEDTHKKKVCVVGKAQFLITNSVVVTFVQVIQSETT